MQQVNGGGDDASAGRNRHANEILLARLTGIPRLGISLDVEAREATHAGDKKDERNEAADLNDAIEEVMPGDVAEHAEAPDPGEHGGRDAKGDRVGQRIEL